MRDSGHVIRLGVMTDLESPSRIEPTDEQLMLATGSGELSAFGRLVDRHHQRALNFAYRMSGDREHSQDIVQESFLRILKAAHRYRPRGRFTAYLYSVVRNMVRETARQRRIRRESPLDERVLGGSVSAVAHRAYPPDPESIRRRAELQDALSTALAALSEELRVVFVLSEIDRLSYREIAQVCGCPEGTVASRKHAAVVRLRALLGPMRSR